MVVLALQGGEDIRHQHFNLHRINGAFFNRFLEAVQHLATVKVLAASVSFDDLQVGAQDFLNGGKARAAVEAFAAATNGGLVLTGAGIENLGFEGGAFWTAHNFTLNRTSSLLCSANLKH